MIRTTQLLYEKYLNGLKLNKKQKIYSAIYSIWRKYLSSFDPEIKIKVGRKFLFLNLSHRLPVYYNSYPNYDRALPRICKKVKEMDSYLSVIDIGANIGDTISLITDEVSGNFLCVEGDTKYLPILEKNLRLISYSGNLIRTEKCYCGDKANNNISIVNFDGTAKISTTTSDNKSEKIEIKTLDKIIEENPDFNNTNLLKIDTDGYEISIINSGKIFIKEAKPLIYFEYTPELYLQNNQDPKEMWRILKEYGYNKVLFYDNFGNAIKIVSINNQAEINNLISKIDKKNIFYYDVLVGFDNTIHNNIIESELKSIK